MQPRIPDVAHHGPWLGLATTPSSLATGPAYAAVAENVLLHNGRIEPRPPIITWPHPPLTLGVIDGYPVVPISMYHFRRKRAYGGASVASSASVLLAKCAPRNRKPWDSTTVGSLIAIDPIANTVVTLQSGLNCRPPSWVEMNGRVYLFAGEAWAQTTSTDGTVSGTLRIGLPEPAASVGFTGLNDYGSPAPVGHSGLTEGETYEWAVTYYNTTLDIESNPLVSDPVTVAVIGTNWGMRILVNANGGVFVPPGVTGYRIYRRNVTDAEVGYRLVAEVPLAVGNNYEYFDDVGDDEIELSDLVSGPFAPVRNGLPPPGLCAAEYKSRVFVSDRSDGDKLRFSAIGKPDYWAPLDFLRLAGGGHVAGMAEVNSQLGVLKEKGCWIVSGDISGPTNETEALGEDPVIRLPETYQTKCRVGCANLEGGNGAIVVGSPGFIAFPSQSGFYALTSEGTEIELSALIRPTWAEFVAGGTGPFEGVQSCSFAVDAERRILFIGRRDSDSRPGPHILAYHFGLSDNGGPGAWTTIEVGQAITCLATAVGLEKFAETGLSIPLRPLGFLVGTIDPNSALGLIGCLDGNALGQMTPPWRYRTSRWRIKPGFPVHLYHAKYHAKPADSQVLDVGYAIDGGAEVLTSRAIETRPFSLLRVAREAYDVALVVENNSTATPYDAESGLLGLELDAELVGHR